MEFTYKIQNYYPYESRIFVEYTPTNAMYEPLGGWVSISPDMSAAQIREAVINNAPLSKWSIIKSTNVMGLIGTTRIGTATPPPAVELVPPAVVPKTPSEIQDEIVIETQVRLDQFARLKNYDGILSACTYATSSIPKFAAEGQHAVDVRDATWVALYSFMAQVIAGTAAMPTGFSDVEPILPPLVWPT